MSSEGSASPKPDQKPPEFVRRSPEQQPGRVGAVRLNSTTHLELPGFGGVIEMKCAANAFVSARSALSVMVTLKNVSVSPSPSAALI